MQKKVEMVVRDGVGILQVIDEIQYGSETQAFHAAIKELIGAGVLQVVVDLSLVKVFSSPMLGVLVSSFSTIKKEGGDIVLAGLTDHAQEVLAVTRIGQVFKVVDTVDIALASLGVTARD